MCDKMNLNYKNRYGDAFCTLKKDFCSPYSRSCESFSSTDDDYDTRQKEYDNADFSNEADNKPGCYLTTAICDVLGYGDDCYYLKMLRYFRDNYMIKRRDCFDLLIEYEVIGPVISEYILKDKETAAFMLDNYIVKAIMFIKRKKYDDAVGVYKEMVYYLKDNYKLNNLSVDMSNVWYDKNLNKYKIRALAKDAKIIYY